MASDEESVHADQMRIAARQARFRRALERTLRSTDEQTTADAVVGALATLIEDHEGAVAFEMAQAGIYAFIHRHAHDRRAVRKWRAGSAGCDPSQDPIDIIDLGKAVHRTAFLYRASPQCISPAGAAGVTAFRAQYLVEHLGKSVPSEATLLEWFSKHNEPHSKGGLTTAGVVARIMHEARLFGARGKALRKTLNRVDRVLARAGIPKK